MHNVSKGAAFETIPYIYVVNKNMQNLFRKKSVDIILCHADEGNPDLMKRRPGVRDLTAMGIAAIIGAGIFRIIGNAAAIGGPAVSVLFIFTVLVDFGFVIADFGFRIADFGLRISDCGLRLWFYE